MRSNIEIRIYNDATSEQYYLISPESSKVWIANQDGEGMGMNLDTLYGLIDEWFKATH